MSRFVLTAQLQLQAPTNTRQVVNQMQQQLQNVNVQINPVINNQALSNANKQLTKVSVSAQNVSKNLRGASRSAESFGSALGAAARRFASITLATGFFLGITRAMGSAVGRAVEFEKEMLKISQVTGKTVRGLQDLSNEVTKLSTTFGVGSEEILGAARTLSQAGLAADQVTKSLRVLAQTDLAATFDNIADTTEGAVALINQFRKEVRAAGSEAAFLEKALDAINAVSKNFAVESADLISVVRRTGGVFEAAGGQLNELIALFTSVRSTTRETADTIATGFRTIFTRIQRTETIDQLKELGIVLQDSTGKFVGPLDAIKRLSAGLSALDPRDFRFNEIVEQLGGFRQIGKVIPLIKQYSTSVAALSVANNSMGSTAKDAQVAQQGLGNQFAQLKEKFDATIRSMVDSGTFRSLADGAIKLAEAVLKIVEAMEPLLPMLTALAAFKLGQIAVPAFGKFAGIGGKNQGGRIHGFNKGGYVPGTGNRDTVPAMLTPGEFVVRKSSVNKIGASKLAKMNGYNRGTVGRGVPRKSQTTMGSVSLMGDEEVDGFEVMGGAGMPGVGYTAAKGKAGGIDRLFGAVPPAVYKKYGQRLEKSPAAQGVGMGALGPEDHIVMNVPFINAPANESLAQSGEPDFIKKHLQESVKSMATEVGNKLDFDIPPHLTFDEAKAADAALASIDLNTISGLMFEAVTSMLSGAPLAEARGGWDMPSPGGYKKKLEKLFDVKMSNLAAFELKKTFGDKQVSGADGSLTTKILNTLTGDSNLPSSKFGFKIRRTQGTPDSPAQQSGSQAALARSVSGVMSGKFFGGRIGAYNKGGSVDTVPAMLTPGEYVINKSAAQSIGYGNLNKMNKQGVANFNTGGPVQFFNTGTTGTGVPGGGGMNVGAGVNTSMEALASSATKLSYQLDTIASSISAVVDDFAALQNVDDKINGAADTLANSIASAVDDINILQSVDDKLIGAIQPLSNSIVTAGAEVSKGVQNFATGMSTIDDHFKAQIDATIGAVKTSMADFAKGLATIDDSLKQQFSAPGKLVEKAMTELTKHLNTFGAELTEKVKIFDGLNKPVGDTVAAMEKFAQSIVSRLDDLNPMSSAAGLMANGLNNSSALFTKGIQLMLQSLGGAVVTMRTALLAGASGFTVVNPFAGLSQLTAPVAQLMGQLQVTLRTVGTQFNTLAQNLAALNASIQAGNTSITQVAGAAFDTDEFFNRLEASIQQFITQMQTAGVAANKAGTGAGTGAAAAGGAVMTGGMGGGKDMTGTMNNMMMAGMMAGMLAQQMSFLSDKMQSTIMEVTMLGSILGMVAMSAAPGLGAALFKLTGATVVASAASAQEAAAAAAVIAADAAKAAAAAPPAAADALKTIAANQAAVADALKATAGKRAAAVDDAKTGAATAAMIALVGLALIATAVMVKMNSLKAEAEDLTKSLGERIKSVQEGNAAAINVVQGQQMLRQALQKEAEAASGGMGALIATVAVTVLAIGILIASAGTATPVLLALAGVSAKAAIAFTAVAATAAYAGYTIGASFATVEEAALGLGDALISSAILASQALSSLSLASKAAELAQLEGADALNEINDRYENIAGTADSVIQSMMTTANIRAGIGANTNFTTDELADSDSLTKASEMSQEALQKLTEELFASANQIRASGAQQAEAMLAEGMDIDEVLNSAAIQRNFKNLARASEQATKMHLLQSGAMKISAKQRLGLAGVADEVMTTQQQMAVAQMEANLIANEAISIGQETVKAEQSRLRAADAARKKQDALEARELAASQETARAAYALAQSFNTAERGLMNLNNSFNAVGVTFSRLTGSITQFKSNLDKQIASLATGDLTTENVGAAKSVGDAFGIGAQVDSLLGSIKETENVRKVLIEKGTKEFTGKLSETAASLRWEDFLSANNLDLSMLSDDIQGEIKEMLEDGLQPQEIETIVGYVNDANEKQIKLLQELAVAQQKYLTTIFKFGGAIIKAEQQFRSAMVDLVKVTQTGTARMAKALGRDLTIAETGRNEAGLRNARLGDLAGGGPARTGAGLGAREAAMASIDKQIRRLSQSAGNEEQIIRLQNKQRELGDESDRLRGHLKALSDQSKLAAAVMKEIDKEGQKRAAVVGFIDDFTFATNKERGDINKSVLALQRVMQTGTLASIPDDMRGAVSGLLDQFSDIAIGPQGQTGDEVRKFLQVQTANQMSIATRGRPLTAAEADKIFNRTTREEELINTLEAISQQEQAAARELAQHALNKQDELVRTLQELVIELRNNMMVAGEKAGPAVEANPFALGGVVYASEGKSIFKPKGTDTVPAMLTPGEFVVNRQAASRNRGALNSINSGKTKYLAGGGSVGTVGSYDANFNPAFKNLDASSIQSSATSTGERAGKLAAMNFKTVNELTKDGFSKQQILDAIGDQGPPWSNLKHSKYRVSVPDWSGAAQLNNREVESYQIFARNLRFQGFLMKALADGGQGPGAAQTSVPADLPASLPDFGGLADYYKTFKQHEGYWYDGGWSNVRMRQTRAQGANQGNAGTVVDEDVGAYKEYYDDLAEYLWNQRNDIGSNWAAFQKISDNARATGNWGSNKAMSFLKDSIFSNGTATGQFFQLSDLNPHITSWDDDDVSEGDVGGYKPNPPWTQGGNPQPRYTPDDALWQGTFGRDFLNDKEVVLAPGLEPDLAEKLTDNFVGNTRPGGYFAHLGDKQSSLLKVAYGSYAKYLDWNVKKHTGALMGYLRGDFSLFPTDTFKGTKEGPDAAAGQLMALMQNWGAQDWLRGANGQKAIATSQLLQAGGQFEQDLKANFLNAYNAQPNTWKQSGMLSASYARSDAGRDSLGISDWYDFGMLDYGQTVGEGNQKLGMSSTLWQLMSPRAIGNAVDADSAQKQRENFAQLMENITKPLGISFNAKGRLKEAKKQQNEQQAAAAQEDQEEKEAFLAENRKLNANLDFGIFNDRAGFMKQSQDFMMENKLFQYKTPFYAFRYGMNKNASRLHKVPPTEGSFDALFPYSILMARELQNFSRGNLLQGFGADNFTLNRGLIRQSLGNVVKDQAGNIVWESTIDPATGIGSADLNAAIQTVNNQGEWSRLFFNGGRQLFGPQGVMGTFTRLPYEDWFTGVNGYGGLIDIEKQIAQLYFANPSFTDGSFAGAMTNEFQGLWQELKGVYNAQANILKQGAGVPPVGGAVAAGGFATGGPVGVSFKPKGTDTVPAMLTPGEFVMKKSAVDKYGMGFMSTINGGGIDNTGPYFSAGGRAVSQFGSAPDMRLDKVLNTVKSNSTDIKDVKDSVSKITNHTQNIQAKTANNNNLADQTTVKAILQQAQANSVVIQDNNDDIGDMASSMLTSGEAASLEADLEVMVPLGNQLVGDMIALSNALAAAQGVLNKIMVWINNAWVQHQGVTFGLAQRFDIRMNALMNSLNAKGVLGGGFKFATGGSVPGAGNKDTVSAMLTPGEFVMKKSAVGKYGKSFMSAINSGSIPQMFANGGPVLDPRFWTTNQGEQEDPSRVAEFARKFTGANAPLFGEAAANTYRSLINKHGRGIWADSSPGIMDPNVGNYAYSGTGDIQNGLYVWDSANADGMMSAFSLSRLSDLKNLDFGDYEAGLPRFRLDGPFAFNDGVGQGQAGQRNPGLIDIFEKGSTPLASVTSPTFAALWSRFSKKRMLPGYSGKVFPQAADVFTFSGDATHAAYSFLKDAVLGGKFDPITNKAGFPVARVMAGFANGYTEQFVKDITEAFPNMPPHHLQGLTGKDFGVMSYFAKGGEARGTDTVPAMLTPGEFVMKKSTVQKYGLGFMRSINNSSPSVRVGRGTQYLKDADQVKSGGFGGLSNVFKDLGTFGSLVSSSLSSFESAFLGFSKLSSMLSDTINSIANLNITHTLNVSGSLNIPGFSQQAIDDIVNTISHQIAESTDGKVKQALRNFKRNLDNRT